MGQRSDSGTAQYKRPRVRGSSRSSVRGHSPTGQPDIARLFELDDETIAWAARVRAQFVVRLT